MEIVDEWTSTSPDGEWIAAGMVAFPGKGTDNPLANVRLVVSRVDGETVWTVIDEFQETGLGFPMPEPHRWSQDGKSFYFTHRVVPDGCSVFAYRVDLYRVDLEDGTVDELLPPYVQTLALSPDESQIAFIGFGERGLALKNLATGEERETGIDPGKSFNAGHLLWSPDGKAFAFTLAIDPCSGTFDEGRSFWAESTSILWMDAETLGRRTLLEEDPRLLVIHEWKENDVVTLMGEDENDLWEMDVETGEIVNK